MSKAPVPVASQRAVLSAGTRIRWCAGGGALASLVAGETAWGHLVSSGLGPFYDGVLHLVVSPAELLMVLAWSWMAGLHGRRASRTTMTILPLAWVVGGLAGITHGGDISLPSIAGAGVLMTGLLVAIDAALPLGWLGGLPALFGVIFGFLNGSVPATANVGLAGLAGVAVTVFVLMSLGSALAVGLSDYRPWGRVVVRVAGSWVGAIGLLMIGWALR